MSDGDAAIITALTFQHFSAFWRGVQVAKSPLDLWVYQEIIHETKPEILLETGSHTGGSAYFFACLFDLIGQGEIVSVDTVSYPKVQHPRITYITGDSVDPFTIATMADHAKGKRTMVALDSLHTYAQVARELACYHPLVTPGCYLVVEDVNPSLVDDPRMWGTQAVTEFLASHPDFTADLSREKFLITCNTNGWLKRRA